MAVNNARPYSSWLLQRVDVGDTSRLRLGVNSIGRHPHCNIRIPELFVSRRHSQVVVADDNQTVTITDTNSANGYTINDVHFRNTTRHLQANDLIGIGIDTMDLGEDDFPPIFRLIYSPLVRNPNPRLRPAVLTSINDNNNNNDGGGNNNNNNNDLENARPSTSAESRNANNLTNGLNDNNNELDSSRPSTSAEARRANSLTNGMSSNNDLADNPRPTMNLESDRNQNIKTEANKSEALAGQSMKSQRETIKHDNGDDIATSSSQINQDNPSTSNEKASSSETSRLKSFEVNGGFYLLSSDDDDEVKIKLPKSNQEETKTPSVQSIKLEKIDKEETSRLKNIVSNVTPSLELKSAIANNDNVVLISDDDDDDDIANKTSAAKEKTTSYDNFKQPEPISVPLITEQQLQAAMPSLQKEEVKKTSSAFVTQQNEPSSTTELVQRNADTANHENAVESASVHVPLLDKIKLEQVRTATANVDHIFGGIEGMEEQVKDINPLIYNKLIGKPLLPSAGQTTFLKSGEHICLTDDDDDDDDDDGEVIQLGQIIPIDQDPEKPSTHIASPNVFENSLNDSAEEAAVCNGKQMENAITAKNTTSDDINLDDYMDEDDFMFSQAIINDMKAELQENFSEETKEDDNLAEDAEDKLTDEDEANKEKPSCSTSPLLEIQSNIQIKLEPGIEQVLAEIPSSLKDSTWEISDDEDYDEELESKVFGWSNKLFSQSLTQNMSQVYELEETSENEEEEEEDLPLDDADDIPNENDIDDIADFYNKYFNDQNKSIDDVIEDFASNENAQKAKRSPERMDTVAADSTDSLVHQKLEEKQKRPEPIEINADLSDSPIIRKVKRTGKTHATIQSSDEEEDQPAENVESSKQLNKTCDKQKENLKTQPPKPKQIPPVIDAPALPRHKGKLRGVSAEPVIKSTSANHIKDKIRHDQYKHDLANKWHAKPHIAKKQEKERKKRNKESRKDKLKELARKNKSPDKVEVQKRKYSADEPPEVQAKKAKVKVTTQNRGAFLANEAPLPPPPSAAQKQAAKHSTAANNNVFKIPMISAKKSETTKQPPLQRSNSTDTFSQQISKLDELLLQRKPTEHKSNNHKKPELKRSHSTNDAESSMRKEAVVARGMRTTNKVTFASMDKNIKETEEYKRKLETASAKQSLQNRTDENMEISYKTNDNQCLDTKSRSSLKEKSNLPASSKPKKVVRFNETPTIYYIERISGARKVTQKDLPPRMESSLSTHRHRRQMVRQTYPIIENTDEIISHVLMWSNEWLVKCNANAEAAQDIVFPMPSQFSSFKHYKSIVLPLMKLEFCSTLERDYNSTMKVPNFKVTIEHVTERPDRLVLVTKYNCQNKKQLDYAKYDLVILESDKKFPRMFAFISANRRGSGLTTTLVLEVMRHQYTRNCFYAIKEFNIRPVLDNIRVQFGAINAVNQLQATPLFHKILNPLELLKVVPTPKKKVKYNGFDKLNDTQTKILLHTYLKIIDENNPNITLLQGPPGTGKSCVITNLALQSLYGDEVRVLDKKILICAQSNTAVDVITRNLHDISKRMREEIRFRIIRFGLLDKIHPSVMPIALQKLVERDQMKKLQSMNKNIQLEDKENLKVHMLQLEAEIIEMCKRNIKGTVEEDNVKEKQRQLKNIKNILNQSIRPEDEDSLYKWYLSNAHIVCATLSSCVKLSRYVDYFDICIIDEATQCTEPATLLPLRFGINSLVLVGDTQQLPATILSKKANELGMGKSMFTRIQNCLDAIPSEPPPKINKNTADKNVEFVGKSSILCGLQMQYRMHPEICRWPNTYFYRSELINATSTFKHKTPIVPFSVLNLSYEQNGNGQNGKIANNLEADFVAKLLKALDGYIPNNYNSYGVITPYATHRNTLEAALKLQGLTNIMVNTIDSYQGLEKDVIVISNARTNGIGFLSNAQRLNVALTRPKKCLILCGNFKNLETVPAWRSLLESARQRHVYHEISTTCINDIQTNVIDKIKVKKSNENSTENSTKQTV